jgi:hypothetical protein
MRIWEEATRLSTSMRCDCTSVQLSTAVGRSADPLDSRFEVQWESKEMPRQAGDRIVGTYGLGVEREDDKGKLTTLLRPKVITDAVLRHAATLHE